MAIAYVPGSQLLPSFGHTPSLDADGQAVWEVQGHQGWFVFTPHIPVENGLYRAKIHASVLGPHDGRSYFDLVDWGAEGRIYASHLYREDGEVYVRLYESGSLQVRFQTDGEAVRIRGVECEAVLLDEQAASPEDLRALLGRMGAAAEPSAVHRVLDRLASWGLIAEAEERRATYVASRSHGETEVHLRLARLEAPIGAARVPAESRPCSPEDIRLAVSSLPLTTFDVFQMPPAARKSLRRLGYEHAFFNATRFHREYDEPPRVWHERPSDPGRAGRSPRHPLFERYVDIDRGFQASMAQGRGFPAHCPVSGELLRSQHGFLVSFRDVPFLFYRFEGVEVFYVCVGQSSNMKLFVYMPRTHTLVWIAEWPYQAFAFREVLDQFHVLLATFADEAAVYLTRPTQPAAVIGNDNYGHFFWVSLTGLQYMVESGLLSGLSEVVKTPKQFIAPEELFPELNSLPMTSVTDPGEAFRHCLVHGRLPIHFTDVAMNAGFAARVREIAPRRATRLPPTNGPRPLLWANLRAHGRVWTGQVEGCANIFNTLYDEHGALSVLLDGTPDCAGIAAEIRARTRREVVLHDGLNFSFHDKLSWAAEIDAYIAPVGTALMIVHTMGGAAGVTHANHEHLRQLAFWDAMLPGSGTPPAPLEADVTEFGVGMHSDYDFDWRILLKLLRPVLENRMRARR